MSKLSDAKEILNALQVPTKQQNGMCCCVLLAMAGLTEEHPWSEATSNWIRIHDVIAFANSRCKGTMNMINLGIDYKLDVFVVWYEEQRIERYDYKTNQFVKII